MAVFADIRNRPKNRWRFDVTLRSLLTVLLVVVLQAPSAAADVLQGTWRANLSASRFAAGFPVLRSQTMQCASAPRSAVACTASRVAANGSFSAAHFTAHYDGRRYPVTGAPEMDNVVLRRPGHAVIAIFSKGTRPVFAYRIESSPDGRHLTIRSIDPRTYRTLYSIVRYDRAR